MTDTRKYSNAESAWPDSGCTVQDNHEDCGSRVLGCPVVGIVQRFLTSELYPDNPTDNRFSAVCPAVVVGWLRARR